MKKKLLLVITKSVWGGAGRYVYDLATSLAEQYDVAVALGGSGPLRTKLEQAGVRVIPVPSMGRDIEVGLDLAAFRELVSIFRAERPDIVHLNSSKAGALGACAARVVRVPMIVFTVHGWAYNEPIPAPFKLFRWAASLVTVLLCHRVITVSHFDRLHSPLGIAVTAVHNGIAGQELVPRAQARRALAERTPFPEDALIVGAIAELHPNKGIDVLVDAASQISSAHVIVIGDGEDRAKLELQIRARRLEERVHLAGFVPDASRLLPAFDIFVMPSRKEGLPYATLEAGAAGLPVIAAAVGGIPEVIEDEISGLLVNAADARGLADAVNALIKQPNTRSRYGEALQERVQRHFSIAEMIRKTVAVYER